VPAVVILAGGEARRLPGKLALDAGGVPLLVRVFQNLRPVGPVYVSCAGSFPPEIDRLLMCPLIVDRQPHAGPAQALDSALPLVREPQVFVVAGDMPFAGAAAAAELSAHWEEGIEAVVPVNPEGRLEPLCALYARTALLRALRQVLAEGPGGVAAAVERLTAKRVRLADERALFGVNTPQEHMLLMKDPHCV
jgi:molybdopterin-guanine dinucleotide biosynthesis protein A